MLKPESYLSLKAVLFPEEAKANLGNAGPSRRVAIWLQWGVLEVMEKKQQGRHSGAQSSGASHLRSLPAANGTLLWGLKVWEFSRSCKLFRDCTIRVNRL